MTINISIDCMGGDHGPGVTVPPSIPFLNSEPLAGLILVGREALVRAELEKLGAAVGTTNLHIYAAMRGQSLADFQKTRNAQVLYSVAGQEDKR